MARADWPENRIAKFGLSALIAGSRGCRQAMSSSCCKSRVHGLLSFLDSSPSPFHAVESSRRLLEAAGFVRLSEGDLWGSRVKPNGSYYFTRNGSSLVAFSVGGKFVRDTRALWPGRGHYLMAMLECRGGRRQHHCCSHGQPVSTPQAAVKAPQQGWLPAGGRGDVWRGYLAHLV